MVSCTLLQITTLRITVYIEEKYILSKEHEIELSMHTHTVY